MNIKKNSKITTPLDALDLVCIIDDTGSMASGIKVFKETMLNLYETLRLSYPIIEALKSFRVKFVLFRDFADGPHAIRESRFFRLPHELDFFKDYIKTIQAISEGDEPENGLEAFTTGLLSQWTQQYPHVLHRCLLITDAPTHPLIGPNSRRNFPGYPPEMVTSIDQLELLWVGGHKHADGTGLLPSACSMLLMVPKEDHAFSLIGQWRRVHHIPVKLGNGLKEISSIKLTSLITDWLFQ
jgi:hypothetical protein